MKKLITKIIQIKCTDIIDLYKRVEKIEGNIIRILPIEDKKIYDVYYEVKG